MPKERRKVENQALRELVTALKHFIAARDAMWSLSAIDRLFRPGRCQKVFVQYDAAHGQVRNAVLAVMEAGKQARGHAGRDFAAPAAAEAPLISMEELEMLLRQPVLSPGTRGGKRIGGDGAY